ncbi:MAG: glycosyltransferase family 4 protein [Methanospirillaceae archaeon]|nr:glycosyltransferase family 4 protein [Methanospirillaceae archaeon]
MKKQPVLFIHHGTIIGGAPVSLSLQVAGIAKRGALQCTIACNSTEMRKFFTEMEIATIPWPYSCPYLGKILIRWTRTNTLSGFFLLCKDCLLLPFSIIQQINALLKCKERVIHLNSAVLISTACAAKITGKKIVWHIREASNIPCLVALAMKMMSDRIVCISPVEASRFPKDQEKIRIVYNPVDFTRFNRDLYDKSKIRSSLGIPEDAKVLVSLGGVNPRKGTIEIIEALKKSKEDTYAIIVGPPLSPDNGNEYHRQISNTVSEEIRQKVLFTGIVKNPAPFIAASDILVFIGKTPHFPRPVYEAWAMKKPVIVNELEGISNNVRDGIDGIISKEPIASTLAAQMDLLYSNPDLSTRMGYEGYRKALLKTSPEISAKKLENIIQELVS